MAVLFCNLINVIVVVLLTLVLLLALYKITYSFEP